MPKRQPIDIKAQILEVCKTPKTKTQIYVELKTPASFYRKYIVNLERCGLLAEINKRYQTTEKGLAWLNAYHQLKQLEQPSIAMPEAANWKGEI